MESRKTLLPFASLSFMLMSAPIFAQDWDQRHWDASWTYEEMPMVQKTPAMTDRQMDFRNDMRKLWEDHVLWTRLFIISAAGDLPDKDATTARLLQNQVDIGNAIRPYYGDAAGDKLTALLKEHILIAADIVTAAKSGDTSKVSSSKASWFSNANEIADFLASANPRNWSKEAMRMHMHDHLNLTFQEASDRLQKNYSADIADYDKVHAQILGMADDLSEGIIKQFSNRFR